MNKLARQIAESTTTSFDDAVDLSVWVSRTLGKELTLEQAAEIMPLVVSQQKIQTCIDDTIDLTNDYSLNASEKAEFLCRLKQSLLPAWRKLRQLPCSCGCTHRGSRSPHQTTTSHRLASMTLLISQMTTLSTPVRRQNFFVG